MYKNIVFKHVHTYTHTHIPQVVLTSGTKQVAFTANKLGYPIERAFMWDDNTELRGLRNVYVVDKYCKMPPKQRNALHDFLDR